MVLTDIVICLCTCFYPGSMILVGELLTFVRVHLSGSAMRKTDRVGSSSFADALANGGQKEGVFARGPKHGHDLGKRCLPWLEVGL